MSVEPVTQPVFVTPKVARKELGVSPWTFEQMMRDGTVKTRRLGRRQHVVYASVLALVHSTQQAA